MSVRFENNFPQLRQQMEEATKKSLNEIGKHITAESKSISPVMGGFLRRSITFKTFAEHKKVSIGSGIKYAKYVHEGTGVYAKSGGRKTGWWYQADGRYYFTKGQKAQPFMKTAGNNQAKAVGRIAESFFKNLGGR